MLGLRGVYMCLWNSCSDEAARDALVQSNHRNLNQQQQQEPRRVGLGIRRQQQ